MNKTKCLTRRGSPSGDRKAFGRFVSFNYAVFFILTLSRPAFHIGDITTFELANTGLYFFRTYIG